MVGSLNRWPFLLKTAGCDAAAATPRFPSGIKQRESRAEELQTQAKYVSVRKANWWPSISLLPSEPVNRRAAITHVLTARNGIFLGWAKGCQAARCRSEKQLSRLEVQQEETSVENKEKPQTHTHTHTPTHTPTHTHTHTPYSAHLMFPLITGEL